MQNFFPLICRSQPYDWGRVGSDSLIYQLLKEAGRTTEENSNQPFAELWMGDHPSLPSFVKLPNGEEKSLIELINEDPEKFLGKAYNHFGKKRLPFLFKVLSVRKALSLQIHPNKEIAKELNKSFPDVYKDDNHKPEISVALSEFEALCNFRSHEELVKTFEEVDAFKKLLGEKVIEDFVTCPPQERKECLRIIFKDFFQKDPVEIKEVITKLVSQLAEKQEKTPRDKLVLRLQEQFPYDIGILLSYLLNYLVVQPGQAFIMDPCEPHAYLQGNCLEAMAASDNVIRGCLTPKFIDKETLCKVLSYNMVDTVVLKGDKIHTHESDGFELLKYPSHYEEFCCLKVDIKGKDQETKEISLASPSIVIVLKGKGNISVKPKNEGEYIAQSIKTGETFFILPDSLLKFTASEDEFIVYIATSQCS